VNGRARKSPQGALRGACATLAALVVLSACTVPVVADLDDGEANRIVAALSANGILADKAAEPGGTGHFRIEVPRDDATRAVSVLSEEGLPAERTRGVLDALGEHSLVPSRTAEHERLLAGIAGDLEHTLGSVDGVLSARVHLAVPRPDPLSSEAPAPASASVLIRHRSGHIPLGETDVRRLVSGAVPGLLPERVAVVDLAVPLPTPRNDLVRVGPASMTREAAAKVRLLIAATAFGNMFLVSSVVVLWMRLRRLRPGLERSRAPVRDAP
jgi:type III secretion protein J